MTKIVLLPSAFDRLDPVARAVRWWTSQMLRMFSAPRRKTVSVGDVEQGTTRLPTHVEIMLPSADGFHATVALPKGLADAHRQALELQVADLAPIPADALCITAKAMDAQPEGGVIYTLAMGRRDRLDQLEETARRRGARSVVFAVEGAASVEIESPMALRKARTSLMIDGVLIASLAAAATLAVTAWTGRILTEAETLATTERALRTAAVAAETARKDGEVARELVERGILTRRGASALEALSTLNRATADNAWWTRVVWTPTIVTLTLQSPDATGAISSLSAAAKDWRFELSGALAAAQGVAQTFDVVATSRERATP